MSFASAVVLKTTFTDPRPHQAAELMRADFSRATVVDCDFRGANLFRADFRGALFMRCRFNTASMTGAQVEGATFVSCETTGADLPDGFRQLS